MAKKYLNNVGSVLKNQKGQFYIKVGRDGLPALKAGQIIGLQTKDEIIAELQAKEGKLNPEMLEKLLSSAEKIPEFVKFQLKLVLED